MFHDQPSPISKLMCWRTALPGCQAVSSCCQTWLCMQQSLRPCLQAVSIHMQHCSLVFEQVSGPRERR